MASIPLVRQLSDERGYLMVALLVAMSVMAIMMTAALPAWHTLAQREKEAELIFRGEQYARALALYQRRFANAPAPSLDLLVDQRFLRRKYKDPITNDEFQILTAGAPATGQAAPGGVQDGQRALQQAAGRAAGAAGQAAPGQGRAGVAGGTGGIVGVASKSPLKSLRLYNGRDTYNQWVFMPVQMSARAGGPAGAAGGRGAATPGPRGTGGRGIDTGRGVPIGPGLQPPQGGRGMAPPPPPPPPPSRF